MLRCPAELVYSSFFWHAARFAANVKSPARSILRKFVSTMDTSSLPRRALIVISLFLWSCGGIDNGPPVTVSLDHTRVKLDQEINVTVSHAPEGWSGEINVANGRHFPINATNHSLRVTAENGFGKTDTDLFVMLVGRDGREIALPNRGRFEVEVVPAAVSIVPDSERLSATAGSGSVRIRAAEDYNWSISGAPDWIKIDSGAQGSGNGTLQYEVAPNTTNQSRTAKLSIGDAVFEVAQMAVSSSALADSGKRLSQIAEVAPVVSGLPMANVTIDKKTLRMGQEIEIKTADVPEEWSGELLVNSLRHFAIESKVYRLKATVENGFTVGQTELYILLTDLKGRQIPLPHGGRFQITVTQAAVSIDRESRNVAPEGGSGSLTVSAAAGYEWSVTGVPDWIKITSGEKGSGNGTVAYAVTENTTNNARSAVLTLGDSTFVVTQMRPSAIQLPCREMFKYSTPPPPIWSLMMPRGATKPVDSPVRWYYDHRAEAVGSISIKPEGPHDSNSLLIERTKADSRVWAFQLILPHVRIQKGAQYKLSVWMRAQNPGTVSMSLEQSASPYGPCGLGRTVMVSKEWAEYDSSFRVTGAGCEVDNNRFSFGIGQIDGKLWIADFSLAPAP